MFALLEQFAPKDSREIANSTKTCTNVVDHYCGDSLEIPVGGYIAGVRVRAEGDPLASLTNFARFCFCQTEHSRTAGGTGNCEPAAEISTRRTTLLQEMLRRSQGLAGPVIIERASEPIAGPPRRKKPKLYKSDVKILGRVASNFRIATRPLPRSRSNSYFAGGRILQAGDLKIAR
ncbi:hypothetical protein B0H17DRAFT_1129943 [Mycena rosella]|uniref:Uncharacterized protein n=1 Tax=Mycena rosella TaxID=1033263 RepID=A0AAD7GJR0_MYCRO|nr:hypothetical protein B0H17DRAFT_1129943 [Mycena rosella]